MGDAARLWFIADLQQQLDALKLDFLGRVAFGWLDRAAASAQHVLVWAANADNFKGATGSLIPGSGQA